MAPPSSESDEQVTDSDEQVADDPVTVEFTFYAPFREAVGEKSVAISVPAETTLGEAVRDLTDQYPDLGGTLLGETGGVRNGVRVLRNGHASADADTVLEDGDELAFTTAIHGG